MIQQFLIYWLYKYILYMEINYKQKYLQLKNELDGGSVAKDVAITVNCLIYNSDKDNDKDNVNEIIKIFTDLTIQQIPDSSSNPDQLLESNKYKYFTPFYISNADFYIVLNHIKIIYNSFLFLLFYSLEHIFLVFHKHP